MTWSHRLLGVAIDADERTIKRAYAAKLRVTRPDEDPEGFQRLNDAYRRALAFEGWTRAQAADDDDAAGDDALEDASSEDASPEDAARECESLRNEGLSAGAQDDTEAGSAPPRPDSVAPGPAPAPGDDAARDPAPARRGPPPLPPPLPPPPETVLFEDSDAFLDACYELATRNAPTGFDAWLRSQPVLWSLEAKHDIGYRLLRWMGRTLPPVPGANFDRIAAFFGYHDLHSGYDPLELQQLRARLDLAFKERERMRRLHGSRRVDPGAHRYGWGNTSDPRPNPRPVSSPPSDRAPRGEDETWVRRCQDEFMHRLRRDHPLLFAPPSLFWNLLRCLDVRKGIVGDIGGRLRRNPFGDIDALPDAIDRRQAAFWLAASDDRRMSRARLLVALIRCIAFASPIMIAQFFSLASESPELGVTPGIVAASILQPPLVPLTLWLANAGWKRLMYWQAAPAGDRRLVEAAQSLLAPVLSAAALLLAAERNLAANLVAAGLSALAASLAFAKLARSGSTTPHWSAQPIAICATIAVVVLSSALASSAQAAVACAGSALGMTLFSILRRRPRA